VIGEDIGGASMLCEELLGKKNLELLKPHSINRTANNYKGSEIHYHL
jgi:hypothetical protein